MIPRRTVACLSVAQLVSWGDPRTYGAVTGRLLVPSLVLSAAAPITYAFIIDRGGEAGALYLSIGLASLALAAALALRMMFPATSRGSGASR